MSPSRQLSENENYGGIYLIITAHMLPVRRLIRLTQDGAGVALFIGAATLGGI